MEKEFIPYTLALALKELGFDEPCFKKYIVGCLWSNPTTPEVYKHIHSNSSDCLAPLYQQAFRWFRKKHGLHVIIDEEIRPQIKDSNGKLLFEYTKDGKYAGFEYEEAELECLKKLIEIVKEKK